MVAVHSGSTCEIARRFQTLDVVARHEQPTCQSLLSTNSLRAFSTAVKKSPWRFSSCPVHVARQATSNHM